MLRVLLVECFLAFFAYGSPEISFISRSQVIDPGNSVELTCHLFNVETYDFGWLKSGKNGKLEVISSKDSLRIEDTRYFLSIHQETIDMVMYTLKIIDVDVRDNGTYECLIYLNDSMMLYNSTSLLVFPKDTKNEIVLAGDNAHLECFHPDWNFNNVIWTRYYRDSLPEGSRVSDGILSIHSSVQDDSGLYMCRAEFNIDNKLADMTRSVKLEVMVPLDIKVRNGKLARPLGYGVNMTCIIYSIAPVTITWSKENQPVQRDSNHDFYVYTTDLDSGSFKKTLKIAELQIKKIDLDDYGYYACSGENAFGIISERIILGQYV